MNEKLEGIEVKVGQKSYIVPPMSLAIAKRTSADRARLNDGTISVEEKLEAAARVMHLSMLRNYPDLQLEELEELITLNKLGQILGAFAKAWSFDPDGEPEPAAA